MGGFKEIEEIETIEAALGIEKVFRDGTNASDFYHDAQYLQALHLSSGGVHCSVQLRWQWLTPEWNRLGDDMTWEQQVFVALA
jgi:hypothetical protein